MSWDFKMQESIKAYHGTRGHEPFERFDEKQLGVYCDNPTTRFGFYLTSNQEDAQYWASRRANRHDRLRLLLVEIAPAKLFEMDIDTFSYYLQRARASTIDKHRAQFMQQGYDGFTVARPEGLWHCMFRGNLLTILQNRIIREGAPMAPAVVRRYASDGMEP